MMMSLETMLQRGFGLVSVTDLISVTMHDDIITGHMDPLPGVENTMDFPIHSRTVPDILEELDDNLGAYIMNYAMWQRSELACLYPRS